ncbi:hypothetical protein DYH09_33420 [bacterium CPR1]|nr:hypothetical protein [bacterium CPR1]
MKSRLWCIILSCILTWGCSTTSGVKTYSASKGLQESVIHVPIPTTGTVKYFGENLWTGVELASGVTKTEFRCERQWLITETDSYEDLKKFYESKLPSEKEMIPVLGREECSYTYTDAGTNVEIRLEEPNEVRVYERVLIGEEEAKKLKKARDEEAGD